MPYHVDSAITGVTAATAITAATAEHAANDVIYIHVCVDFFVTWPTISGWTNISEEQASQHDSVVYRKVAASSSETMPTITTGSSADYIATTVVIRDADTTTPEGTIINENGTSASPVSSTYTTAGDDRLSLCLFSQDANRGPFFEHPAIHLKQRNQNGSNGITAMSGWQYYPTGSTLTTAFTVRTSASDDYAFHIIPINPNAGSSPAYAGADPYTVINPMAGSGGYSYGGSYVDDSATLGTPWDDAHVYAYDQLQLQTGASPKGRSGAEFCRSDSASYNGSISGGTRTATSVDATNKYLVGHLKTDFLYSEQAPASGNGGMFIGVRSNAGTSYRVWLVAAQDTVPDGYNTMPFFIDPTDTGFIHEVGTFDVSDIDGLFVGIYRIATEVRYAVSNFRLVEDIIVVGGSAADPGTFATAKSIADTFEVLSVEEQIEGQIKSFQNIAIGDGGTTVSYFNTSGINLKFPEVADEVNKRQFRVAANTIGLKLDLGASDTCTITDSAISGVDEWELEFDLNATSTVDVSGTIFSNANVTFTSVAGTELSNSTFRGCASLPSGVDLDGVTIDSTSGATSAITLNGATELALQGLLDNLENSTLTNNTSTSAIRIEYTGTGDISLNYDNVTTSGNTVDVHYNSTNASQLTLSLINGSTTPTTVFSGAATGVTISSAALPVSITSIVNGSRVQIYNVTTAAEIYNDVPGTSYSTTYTEGSDYTTGDEVRVRITYTSGTSAKAEWSTTTLAGASGWSVLASQVDDTIYNTNAVDGSTITKFTADFVNNEIDLVASSNFTAAEAYAFYMYTLTTAAGIVWFGGVTAVDLANYRINTAILALYFNNNDAVHYWQTDTARIFRDDGARPIKNPTTGVGGIDVNWMNVVYTVSTGSVLTAGEKAQLANASDQADIIVVDTADMQPKVDEIHIRSDLNATKPNTYASDGSSITNDDFTLTKDGDGLVTKT